MSYYYSGATLQKGSTGADVSELQRFLTSQGYYTGAIDGDFGPETDNALRNYQEANGLYVDGIFGPKSSAAAGFKNYNTPTSAPTISPAPTAPTYDTTSWDDTDKGKNAADAYDSAKDAVDGYGPFSFSENEWLNQVKDNIANYGEFSYNFNEDALYQQAVERYQQMGKMAMQDTMGQAAALTGGYGNSYAATAGNQAYQSYLQEAHNLLPEFYQMALQRYTMGKEDLYNQYGMLLSEYEREYGLYSDEYNNLLDKLGIARDDYYDGGSMFYSEQDNKNTALGNQFADAMSIWGAESDNAWKQAEWDESMRRYAIEQQASSGGSSGGSGGSSGGSSGGGSGNGGGSGYDNGSVDISDIKAMQNAIGVTADGKWGPQSKEAAGGLSADEAYKAWQNGTLGGSMYSGWDAGEWEAYFAAIRQSEGVDAAEEEFNRMNRERLIPQNMIVMASIGVRGSGLGH